MGILSGTLTASTEQSGYEAAKAGDLNFTDTRWAASDPSLPQWLQWDVGSAQGIDYYVVAPSSFSSTQNPTAWELRGSNDPTFATYTVIDSRSGVTFASANGHYYGLASSSSAFRYYRLHITANGGATTSLLEFEIGSLSGTFTPYSTFTPIANGGGGYTLGVVHEFLVDGAVNGVRYWQTAAMTGTTKLNLYDTTGAVVASTTQAATGTAQWRTATLGSPLSVSAGDLLMATVYNAGDFARVSTSALLTFDNFFGPVRVVAHAAETFHGSTNNPRYTNADAEPGSFFNAAPYAVSVEFAAAGPTTSGADSAQTSVLEVSSTVAKAAAAALTVASLLATAATGVTPAAVDSSVSSVLAATPGGLTGAAAEMASGSALATAPVVTGTAAAGSVASSTLAALAVLERQAAAESTQTSTLAATTAVGDLPAEAALTATSTLTVEQPTVGLAVDGWTVELTGRALVGVDTSSTDLYVPPSPAAIPGAVTPRMLHRNSQVMDAPTAATPVIADTDVTVVDAELGIARVWVDGVDRTYTDDGELLDVDDMVSGVGLGDRSATATVKGMQIWDRDGEGAWSWLRPGAQVEAGVVHPDTGARVTWWAGDLMNPTGDNGSRTYTKTWEAAGPLTQLMRATMQPLDSMPPTDIGIVIPRVVNAVISRDFPPMPTVRTGILTTKRGSYGQKVGEYVREVLATAWVGNRQWRPARDPNNPRRYLLTLTDTTTVHWTVTAGAVGVKPQLGRDWSQNENAFFGRGTLTGGHRWMNRKYPYLLPYAPPEYFNADPDAALTLGSTDADTRNDGVSLLQRRLQELGYKVTVTGVYDTQTRAAVIRLQRKRGLLVDGITAGQTWTSVWSIGATGADLRSVRLPLATDPRVEPWLYLPNGAIAAPNPEYDQAWPRVEADLEYGENTTLELGIDDALQRVDRALTAPLMGTITLTTCPWEGSRWEILEGQNILLKGWEGQDVLLHVVDVRRSKRNHTVTLTVDEAFRDALTVHEVMVRNAESKQDPARRPGAIGRTRGTSAPDMTTPYDGESAAGKIPELTIRAGLWSVWPVALDEVGTLARAFLRTYSPACRFAVLLFGQPILPSQLVAGVGNVLAKNRPWKDEDVANWLFDHGFIEGWGHQGQACGFGTGDESKGDPLKGWSEFRVGVQYKTTQPPFIHLAVLAEANCHFSGELDPEPKV